jgi:hypothetical protein
MGMVDAMVQLEQALKPLALRLGGKPAPAEIERLGSEEALHQAWGRVCFVKTLMKRLEARME